MLNELWRIDGADRRRVLGGVLDARIDGDKVWAIDAESITVVAPSGGGRRCLVIAVAGQRALLYVLEWDASGN